MPHSVSAQLPPQSPEGDAPQDMEVDQDDDREVNSQSTDTVPTSSGETASSATSDVPSDPKTRLDDMFDDDEEMDNELASSGQDTNAPLPPMHSASYSDPEVMRAFYQRLFPYRHVFQWLNHSPSPANDFQHREFAFTLPGDIYLRYQSFATADLFRKQCIQQIPSRFEIGPVYTTNPRDRKTLRRAAAFRPISKELVFDIDMTDYDEIRTCCTGASICHRCWSFIRMAIKVVDVALRDDFGFKHILWVYSGRRGVHAWVCDKKARVLDDAKRRSIANYLELLKGGDKSGKKVNARRPLHPHIDRSLQILREHFQSDILQDQNPWCDPKKAEHLLSLLPDKQLAQTLSKKWEASPSRSSSNKWADIDATVEAGGASTSINTKKLLESKQDIILEYTYPRLDAEVSKHLNHLLKSPFCVHPGTGRICVPIDPRKVDDFDPLDVPTVTELLGQVDEWKDEDVSMAGDESNAKRIQDWDKTRLKVYVDYFRGFVNTLLREEQGEKRTRDVSEQDAMDF